MATKKTKPTSAGVRFRRVAEVPELHQGAPYGPLTIGRKRVSGRNNDGRMTMRRRGGGHKKRQRIVDFKRNKDGIPAGTVIHNIELKPGKGGQVARSAGVSAQLLAREGREAQIRMASGEVRRVSVDCRAVIGEVSNSDHANQFMGKAGANRWRGRRPKVRGVSMNPVDHPHGGGEGHTAGGRHPVTPWGQPTKGHRTRNNKRTDKLIVRRRKK